MAKFYGTIGFVTTVEKAKGVYVEEPTERQYYGDLIRNTRKIESSGYVNDDINVSNEISIVADAFAYQHFASMKYVVLMDAKWKITSVEVQYPRLKLTVGGLYNG